MSESLGFLAMCLHVGYKSASTGVTVDGGIVFFAECSERKKILHPQKKGTMPSALRIGSSVSSKKSSLCKLIDPPIGRQRKVRERIRGVIVRSLPDQKWLVQWATGQTEEMKSNCLKNEEEPSEITMDMVRMYNQPR